MLVLPENWITRRVDELRTVGVSHTADVEHEDRNLVEQSNPVMSLVTRFGTITREAERMTVPQDEVTRDLTREIIYHNEDRKVYQKTNCLHPSSLYQTLAGNDGAIQYFTQNCFNQLTFSIYNKTLHCLLLSISFLLLG